MLCDEAYLGRNLTNFRRNILPLSAATYFPFARNVHVFWEYFYYTTSSSSSSSSYSFFFLLYGLGRLTCSGIDALPSFPAASTISSSSGFVFEGVIRQSGVFRSLKLVDPVLFVFESHVLYSRDLQFFSYDFASYFIQPCVSCNTS